MRLIDADALCKDLLERWNIADTNKERLIQDTMAYVVTPIVVGQPTINLVRYGRWICENSRGDWHCDYCGHRCLETYMNKPVWKFCPHCGHRMEEEIRDEQIN